MGYSIRFSKRSIKALKKLPRPIKKRIVEVIQDLRNSPFSLVRAIPNCEFWRLRVGAYRVILFIDTDNRVVRVIDVHRKDDHIYNRYR